MMSHDLSILATLSTDTIIRVVDETLNRMGQKLYAAEQKLQEALKAKKTRPTNPPRNTSSGMLGVHATPSGSWSVSLTHDRVIHYGGTFKAQDFIKACRAAQTLAKMLGKEVQMIPTPPAFLNLPIGPAKTSKAKAKKAQVRKSVFDANGRRKSGVI